MKEFITIGKIINTHGIKGELKIYPLTDDPKRFNKLDLVYIDGTPKRVLECKFQSKRVILKIQGVDSIEEATSYKGKYLEISRKDAVDLNEGTYFIADIIGCSVVDEDGMFYGKIGEVLHTHNNDVYWIKGKNELLIPAIKDVIVDIDVEKEKIVIKPVKTWM
ncbi:MAG TPA: 16S rRNA processing protein RimM [Clostridium sp.]|jgi:16S rRNA processing protein RimM|uniref:Ribosome maturation factor RimM n=1 Tax=Clostridium lapidicellarium TaxID=3240931 RepID=A0ABV4DUD0_9CLOT|nr:ribosome maturation factor RimM [uncultured Clostridium sp.]NLU08329.1 16S rRNA processing protein RimM [Clostridiales bacterium]HBC97693.1 16S rRNA processing protein RimM [Clostridium sp.]